MPFDQSSTQVYFLLGVTSSFPFFSTTEFESLFVALSETAFFRFQCNNFKRFVRNIKSRPLKLSKWFALGENGTWKKSYQRFKFGRRRSSNLHLCNKILNLKTLLICKRNISIALVFPPTIFRENVH